MLVRFGFPTVDLGPYWIDRYEVTNSEFKEFVDAGGYQRREVIREVLDWLDTHLGSVKRAQLAGRKRYPRSFRCDEGLRVRPEASA